MRVHDILLSTIQSYVHELRGEVSNKTLHNIITLLKVMLTSDRGSSAAKLGYIGHNPALGLELPRMETRAITVPTEAQVWKLIHTAEAQSGIAHELIFIAAFTGLRRGEILALNFGDVEWEKKELLINKAISRAEATDQVHKWRWEIGAPKTRKSVRRVVLTDDVADYLRRLQQVAAKKEGLVFPRANGEFIDPDYFDDSIFAPVKKAADLTSIRFHDLRHFFASLLISQGFSPKYVCDQMGHSSIQVTFDTYGHLFPKAREEASKRLQQAIQEGKEKNASVLLAQAEENEAGDKPEGYLN